MHKNLLIVSLIVVHGNFFAGGDKTARNAVTLLKKIEELRHQDVLMRRHIPTLLTFAVAQLPEREEAKIPYTYWLDQVALKNQDMPVPQNVESFWYLYLTCDPRLCSITPTTTSTKIKQSIEAHGYLVPQKTTSRANPKKNRDK